MHARPGRKPEKRMSTVDEDTTASSEAAPEFIPGLQLNALFYGEVVKPLLAEAFPNLPYSAALIGYGSEVLGYDTARSTDHEWGPRMLLLLSEEDHTAHAADVTAMLSERLPPTFRGYSTHFGPPGPDGVQQPAASDGGPISHKILVYSPGPLLTHWLGVDPFGELSAIDWLLIPQQKLLEITAGRVYHDGLGVLEPVRSKLAWYPHDVWLYLMAAQWGRISQQEAFVGRAGEVGDELGSALVAADLVGDLMRLCSLIERRYAPYSKWFGTAFAALACAPRFLPLFQGALRAETWREREDFLASAYEIVAGMHNALGVTASVDPRTRPYHGRPFQVLHAERFCEAITAAITDPDMRALVDRAGLIGSIDQISDNVDAMSDPERYPKFRTLYEP
jgi:hypothetical protein